MIRNLLSVICLCFITFLAFSQQVKPASDTKKMDKFINGLMKQMTLEEKIGQLNLITPGSGILTGSVVSKNVEDNLKKGNVGGMFGIHSPEGIKKAQDLVLQNTRLKIPLLFGSDVIHGYHTAFPIPLGLAASWDMALIEQSAQIAAQEASANGLNWTFSPMVDIARDPRWGRVAEGAGEDPYLGGKVAAAMVRGYQGDDLSKNNTILACVKHFALYGAAEGGRDYNTTDMSRMKMYETYLPPYKAAVDAGVASVMSSFNDVDGVPATGNKWLLDQVLRKEWGFGGFVVSDYTSVNEMTNHGLGDLQTVSALALNAGLDMDMVGEGFLTTLKKSLAENKVTKKQIDQACRRILEAKYKLGLFDDPNRYIDVTRPAKELLTANNRAASRKIAAHSFVLLKNEANALPLKQTARIALVGPLANDKTNMLGTWMVSGDPQLSIPIMEGLKNVAPNATISYAKGANLSNDPNFAKKINVFGTRIDIDARTPETMLQEALTLAAQSDVVVAVVGEASEMSGESACRTDLNIPESQKVMLRALKKTGKPLVVVLMSGRPLTVHEEHELADAMLLVWHPGTEAGNAVGDVLFGDINPSGKLTMTFPRNVGQIPIYHSMKPTGRPQAADEFEKFKSNYLDAPNSPLYPFGHGLSYTKFSYSDIKLSSKEMYRRSSVTASVTVTNTGNYDGEEVVQMYIRDVEASISRPLKELKGFQKVMLKKGESKTINFEITNDALKFYNSQLMHISEAGTFKVMIGGSSNATKEAEFELRN